MTRGVTRSWRVRTPGCHLITDQIYEKCPEIRRFAVGTAQVGATGTCTRSYGTGSEYG